MQPGQFAENYRNQVIYIESIDYRAHWLHAHGKDKATGDAHLLEVPESDVINDVSTKWKVKKKLPTDSTVVLESVQFRNHYLGAHHHKGKHLCNVKYLAYPYDDEKAIWYLEDIDGSGQGKASFQSKFYSDFRINSHPRDVNLSKGSGQWSVFRIYQPTVQDRKELLFSYDNTKGTTPVETEYTEQTGISKTNTTTESATVTTQIGVEIESVFSAKASFSSTWSMSTSATWNSEITKKVSVEVPPGTKKDIYQLTGYYGEDKNKYRVASSHLFFEG